MKLGSLPPGIQGLSGLKMGQAQARLLSLEGTSALLQLGSRKVSAQLQGNLSNLTAGSLLKGSLSQNAGVLRFQVFEQLANTAQTPGSGSSSVDSFLKGSGLPQDGLHRTIAKVMDQAGLPLNAQTIRQLSSLSQFLPSMEEANVQALLILVSNQVPLSKKIVQEFKKGLEGRLKLKASLLRQANFDSLQGKLPVLDHKGLDLRSALQRSGLSTEAQLLSQAWDGDDLTDLKRQGKRNLVKEFKEFYTLLQLRNSGSSTPDQSQVLILPYMVDGELKELIIEWKESESSQGVAQSGAQHLNLYLEMSELGSIQLNFTRSGERVSLGLVSPLEESISFMQEFEEEIKNSLEEVPGISEASVWFRTSSFVIPDVEDLGLNLENRVDLNV